MRSLACCWMLVAATVAPAQQSEPELRAALLRAFRGIDAPGAQGFADLDAVHAELVRLVGELDVLEPRRRAQTRFFLAVRRADARLRQRRLGEARAELEAAIPQARADGVWSGSFRTHAIVIAAECFDEAARAALLAAEREHLLAAATLTEADWLEVPVRLLRVELEFAAGRDRDGMAALEALATEVRDRLSEADDWRTKCVGRFAWELLARGDLARAERWFRALPLTHQRYPIGLIALRRGDHDLAERAGRALLRTERKLQGGQLLGEALEAQGRIAEALAVYRDLLAHADAALDRAVVLRSLGDCAMALWRQQPDPRQLEAARASYADALAATDAAAAAAAAERVQVLARLGEVHELAGDPAGALQRYRESLAVAESARARLAGGTFGRTWLGDVRHLWAIDGVLRLAVRGHAGADGFAALAAVEVGRARTLLDWTVAPPRAADTSALGAALARVLAGDATTPGAAGPAEFDAVVDRRAAGAPTAAPADAAALAAHVAAHPDRSFVMFWCGAETTFALLARGAACRVVALGPTVEALRLAGAARAAVATPDAPATAALAAASAWFFPPPVAAAVAAADGVTLSPGPELEAAPFEAMPLGIGSADAEPLGLGWPVERAASLTIHRALSARAARATPAAGGAVLLLDSVTAADLEASLGLDPLAFSDREAELVARAYGDRVTRLTGAAATRDGLASRLGGAHFDLVHVSAHGVLDPRVPTASLLLLADGPVTLLGLCSIELRDAFVVLSACSLATGEVRAGEGNLALVGWPVAAGGRGATAALWAVNQQATADLMGQFHAFRAAGLAEPEAMRQARRALAAAPQYAHPHYWSGFGVWAASPRLRHAAGPSRFALGVGACGIAVALAFVAWRRARSG